MSGLGLGGYESSDEDDGQSREVSSAVRVEPTPNGTTRLDQTSSVTAPAVRGARRLNEEGPMVGPTMPERMDDDLGVEEQAQSPQPQQHMSERETIHYLTQASHPMTSIPPSPPGSPDPTLNAKFKRFLELKAKGLHFDEDLANKSSFRNPGLLATMMTRAGIEGDDQYKTSLPLDVFDPTGFPPSAYKEELLRSQQSLKEREQAARKSLSATGKRSIEFTSGGTSGASSRDSTPGVPNKRKRA
ncbi:hypothetical protein H2200_009192 [Cladophialophora chaetospira]|uniref:HCNGP-like protein n=1 Tax=Cladophialophora chaetospira TaxID=386627 RepID=A0AA38X3N7_9EURO|nr:hypothetical protein H2200_009192 [Cladophialophora chaetospira]